MYYYKLFYKIDKKKIGIKLNISSNYGFFKRIRQEDNIINNEQN